jgi:molecular chaperone DnaK (HSP70)
LLTAASFKSIDPTPCHQSAHPLQHQSTVAFSINDGESEESNTVTVSEITTRHLRRLAASASDFLGQTANAAVITVPTNFSKSQKDALTKAASDANIEVLQYINEPVAAVLAYDARAGPDVGDKNVVVVDVGGTRSDVAVIASRGGIYTILATAHDYDISGSQLDRVVIDYFAKEFLKKYKSASPDDPRNNDRSLAKLKLEAEAVRKALSLGATANFGVESLSGGLDYTATINRTRFELLAGKELASITRLVLSVLKKADLDPLDVTSVILAGGSSHTPRIARNLEGAFPEGVEIFAPSTRADAINPSELAARGAAIQASLIMDYDLEDVRESCHPVVTATAHLSTALGVLCISGDDDKGVFVPVVESHTPVPVRRTRMFGVPAAGGDVLIKLCEARSTVVVKTVEKKPKAGVNGEKDSDDDSDDDSDEDDEEEQIREKKWAVGKTICEAAIRGAKKGSKVEVQVNIGSDLAVTLVAREVGGKAAVRGAVESATH